MTSQIYFYNTIKPIVFALHNDIGSDFILMDDNVKPHRSKKTSGLKWIANSPDMNPIKNFWDFSRAIHNGNHPLRAGNELAAATIDEWNRIPQEVIKHS